MRRGVKVKHRMPVLELGQVSGNAASPGRLTALRASQLQVLSRCPRTFYEQFINTSQPQRESKAGRLGTLCHEAIEAFLRRRFDLDTPRQREVDAALGREGLSEKERALLWQYCMRLAPDRPKVLAVEHEFTLMVVPDALPLRGHIDLILQTGRSELTIVDHKTNRRRQQANWWAWQLQPLAYAYAARRLYPGATVRFRIGYVLQDRDLEWLTTPGDDDWFQDEYKRLHNELAHAQRKQYWQARANEHCRYCPVVDHCAAPKRRDEQFLASLNLPRL